MKQIQKTAKVIHAFGKSLAQGIFLAFLLGMMTSQSATVIHIGNGECEVELDIPSDYPNDGSRPSNVPDGFEWEMDTECVYVWGPCNRIYPTFENVVDEHNIQLEYRMEIGRIHDEYNDGVATAQIALERRRRDYRVDGIISAVVAVSITALFMVRFAKTGTENDLNVASTAGYGAIAITVIGSFVIMSQRYVAEDLRNEIATLEQTRDRALDAALQNRERAIWRLP